MVEPKKRYDLIYCLLVGEKNRSDKSDDDDQDFTTIPYFLLLKSKKVMFSLNTPIEEVIPRPPEGTRVLRGQG